MLRNRVLIPRRTTHASAKVGSSSASVDPVPLPVVEVRTGAPLGPSTGPSVAEVLSSWRKSSAERSDIGERTKDNYARAAGHLIAGVQGASFDDPRLHDYVRDRRDRGVSARSIAFDLGVLRMAHRWAREEGLLPPTAMLRCPRVRVDPRQFTIDHTTPTPEQVGRMLTTMPADDWRLATVLLARTGARVGEIVRLRRMDLDVERRCLALGASRGDSKTGLRWFPLDADSFAALEGRTGVRTQPLLALDGLADPKQALRRRLVSACERAGIPAFTPHGLRRMVVGQLMRAAVDPGTAASLTGHSVSVMLRLYQEVSDEDRRRAVEQAALGSYLTPSTS